MDLRAFIRDVPDFPNRASCSRTSRRSDGSFGVRLCLREVVRALRRSTRRRHRRRRGAGFLFAAPMALELRKPLIPLRKPGKLPYRTHSFRYDLEYGSAELHVHTDAIPPGCACSWWMTCSPPAARWPRHVNWSSRPAAPSLAVHS